MISFSRIWQLSFVTFIVTFLAACDGKVEGDVFIVKGGGNIAVSPGRAVTFIPYESEMALLKEASVGASKVALASIEMEVGKLCPNAVSRANAELDRNRNIIKEITQKRSVPKMGCGGLKEERDSAADSALAALTSQKSERERLEAALQRAKSARSKKIDEIAADLKQKQMAKVVTSFTQTGDNFVYSIFNTSDYCIGKAIATYSTTIWQVELRGPDGTLVTTEMSFQREAMDEYGFTMKDCFVPEWGKIAESVRSSTLTLDTPELKKAAAEGSLETIPCGYGRTCAKVDSVTLVSDYDFYAVEKTEIGSKVSYKTNPVNWKQKASKSDSLSELDKEIDKAKANLNAALSRHKKDSTTLAASQAETNYQQCIADNAILDESNRILSEGQGPYSSVESCSGDSSTIASGLAALDSLLGLKLDIPDAKDPYRNAFLVFVVSAFGDESAITTSTSIHGHYSIERIPAGRYLVMAEYADNFVSGFWLNAVEITSGEQVIDLNQNTFVPFFLTSYLQMAAQSCESCVSGAEPIPNRIELTKALERRKADLEEVQESLNELERTLRRFGRM